MVPFLHSIGTCPICHKGQLMENEVGFTCNHFKKTEDGKEDKCNFVIYRSYHGMFISENIARQLVEKGVTDIMTFNNRDGQPFQARLKIEDAKVITAFDYDYLDGKCPNCGGRIKITKKGYVCENCFKEGEQHCDFNIRKTICNRAISKEEAERFINGQKDILDGFVTNQGKTFSSILNYAKGMGVHLESRIGRCPKCGGDIHVGIKAFNCSNFRNPAVQCNFRIWREHHKHNVTVPEAKQLLEKGITDNIIDFTYPDGNNTSKRLTIDADYKVIMV